MCDDLYGVWLSECKHLSNKKRKFLVELFGSTKNVYCASENELTASMKAYGEIFGNYGRYPLKFDNLNY